MKRHSDAVAGGSSKKQKRATLSSSKEIQLCTADSHVKFDLAGVTRRCSLTSASAPLMEDGVIGWCGGGVAEKGVWLVVEGSSIACLR